MGAVPYAYTLSLCLPKKLNNEWLNLFTKSLFSAEVPKSLNVKNCHPISSKDLKSFSSKEILRNNIYINIEFYNYSEWIKLLYGAIGYS